MGVSSSSECWGLTQLFPYPDNSSSLLREIPERETLCPTGGSGAASQFCSELSSPRPAVPLLHRALLSAYSAFLSPSPA